METLKKKIKEWWGAFVRLTKSNGFIFIYPCVALTILSVTPPRILPFLFLVIWFLAVINNTQDED